MKKTVSYVATILLLGGWLTINFVKPPVVKAESEEILHFSSNQCSSCTGQPELVEQIAAEHGIQITLIDVNDSQEKVQEYQVSSVPELILLRDGQEIGRLDGRISTDQLETFLTDMENVEPQTDQPAQADETAEMTSQPTTTQSSSSKTPLIIGVTAVLAAVGGGLLIRKTLAKPTLKDPNTLVTSPADGSQVSPAQAKHEQALLDQGFVYNAQKDGFDYVPKKVVQKDADASHLSKRIQKDKLSAKKRKGILDDEIAKIHQERVNIVREQMASDQKDYKRFIKRAETMDTLAKGAQIVEDAADVGVDVLSEVTGPAGKSIKKGYEMAKDAVTVADHIATEGTKGIISGAKDVATGKARSKALGKLKVPKSKLANKTLRHAQDSVTDKVIDKTIGDKLP